MPPYWHPVLIEMIRRHFRYFAFYVLYWMAVAFINPYLALILTDKGMSGTETGIILSLFNAISVAASLFVSYQVDRFRCANIYLNILTIGVVAAVLFLYFARSFILLNLLIAIYGFCSSPTNDIMDKSIMDELAHAPEKYASYRVGGSIGFGLGIILSAIIIKQLGLDYLIFAFVIIMSLNLFAVQGVTTNQPCPGVEKNRERALLWKSFLTERRYIPYLVLVLFGLGEVGINQYLAIHLLSINFEVTYVSIFVSISMIGEIIAFLFMNKIILRIGLWKTIAIGFFVQALRLVALVNIPYWPLAISFFFQVLGGASFSLVYSAITQLVASESTEGTRTIAQSLKTVANRGIGQGIGSLFFGFMIQYYSVSTGYVLAATLSISVFSLIIAIIAIQNWQQKHPST